jgi:hypothetical protein
MVQRLRKSRAIPLLPLKALVACSRVSFTVDKLPLYQDFQVIHLRIKQFLLYCSSCENMKSKEHLTCHLFTVGEAV